MDLFRAKISQLDSDKLFLPAQEENYLDFLKQEANDIESDLKIRFMYINQAYSESLLDHKEKLTNLLKAYKRLESENRRKDLRIALLEERLNQDQRKKFMVSEQLNDKKEIGDKDDLHDVVLCGAEFPIDCPQSTRLDESQSLDRSMHNHSSSHSDSDELTDESRKDSSSKVFKFVRAFKALRNKHNNTKHSKRLLNTGFVDKKPK